MEIALAEAKSSYTSYQTNVHDKPEWFVTKVNPVGKVQIFLCFTSNKLDRLDHRFPRSHMEVRKSLQTSHLPSRSSSPSPSSSSSLSVTYSPSLVSSPRIP